MHTLECAIGALHDQLEREGFASDHVTEYLVYRLRREFCVVNGDQSGAATWSKKISDLSAEGRFKRADEVLAAYRFGEGVNVQYHQDAWDVSDVDDLIKVVYAGYDTDAPEDALHKLSVHVKFTGACIVTDAYALDVETGNHIGSWR